jgi:low temperature requirement protein LtrA
MQGAFTLQHAALRPAFVRYSTVALVSPVVVVIGAYLAGDVRVFTWAVAALIAIVAALRGGGGEWAINTTHFAERHALFVIIALGEVVVASGATTYLISEAHGLTGELVLAMSIAVGVAGLWWWTYFAYIPDVGERALRTTAPRARGALARDFYSFGHFPLVIGIVLLSVVVEHVLEHPSDALPATERWLLAAAVVAFTGGLVLLRVRLTKRWSPERLIAIGLTILLCAFGRELSGIAILGLVAVVQAISQGVRYWLYTREERASTNPS